MPGHISFGSALAGLLLLPGNVACDAMGLGEDEKRDLVRMLINSLAWIVVGVLVMGIWVF